MSQIPESTGNVPAAGAENGNANITQRRHKLLGDPKLATVDPWGGIKTEMKAVHTNDEFEDPDLVAALNQANAHHGNPRGMVTPVDSGDEQPNHDKDALSEVKQPIQIRKTSDHLGKNAASSPKASADLDKLAMTEAKRLIYEAVRSDIGCPSTSKTDDRRLQDMLDALGCPDNPVLQATTRAWLAIALERGQKYRQALLREQKALESVAKWKQCYVSLQKDFSERGVELGLLQAKVEAYEARTRPESSATSAPNRAHQSQQNRQINFDANLDDLDQVFNVKNRNDPSEPWPRKIGPTLPNGPARPTGNFPDYLPNGYPYPDGYGNWNQPNFGPNFDERPQPIYLEDQKRIDARVRTLKLEPKFTGRAKSHDPTKQDMAIFDRWYRKVQGQLEGASDNAKLAAVVNALEEDAYQLYSTLSAEQSTNYRLVMARLSDHFKSRMTREQLRTQL
ncbi:hypothetical protein KC887_09540, partial [Candidatus Kaiserbacteria bacterium]|nr:hypothetical protein [Candidatus Kaiserbacteria bacterium]